MGRRAARGREKPKPQAGAAPHRRAWRTLLVLVGAAAVVGGGWAVYRSGWRTARRASDGLNVLLITLDTTRADHVSCYGPAPVRTPNLDRLAAQGARFAICRTCSPLTAPSHASIMTSTYPYVHGVRRNGTERLAEGNITLAETLRAAGLKAQATIASFVLNRLFGQAQGFDAYHDVAVHDTRDALHAERKGDEVCRDAQSMLRALARERFFLWVHFYDPHFPYESARGLDRASAAAYADEIAFMDQQVGHLLDTLDDLNLTRSTLVVIVGDHGEGLGAHGESQHGTFLYDTTLRVPLLMRCPGKIPAGRVVEAPVRTIDVAPTILDLVEVPRWEHAQGVSLVGMLRGEQAAAEVAAYAESLEAHANWELSILRSITMGEWKYILAPRAELYDLRADTGESRNLVLDQPQRAAGLRADLRQLLAEAPPLPDVDVDVVLTPGEVALLESLGYVGSRRGPDVAAASELDRFEPQGGDPKDHVRVFELKAQSQFLIANRDYANAERLLREVQAAMPHVAETLVDLTHVVLEQGRLDDAQGLMNEALSLAPADPNAARAALPNLSRVQSDIGRALQRAGRNDEAARAFERALAIDPDYPQTLRAYAEFLLYAARDFAGAARYLTRARDKLPDNVDVLHDLAIAQTALRQFDEAERYLTAALRLDPQAARLHQALGVLRLQQRRLPEAAQCFRKVLELDPESREAQQALQHVSQLMQTSPAPAGGPAGR